MNKKCLICQNNCNVFTQLRDLIIYKCPSCGFGFTENVKLQKGEYHRDETYIEEEDLFENIFQKRVNLISQLQKPGKVLEVGCSTGLLLSLLKKKGWEVEGVELSKKAAEVARSRGIDAVVGTFEEFKTKNKYNLIIFNHVLEHLENPQDILEKAKFLLFSRGLILISLPNFDSFSASIQKGAWPLLLPEEHLWHFTPKSMRILLTKLGLKTIYEEEISGIWDYGNPLLGLWRSLKGLKKRFIVEVLSAVPTFLLTKLNKGSGMIVFAKKE